MRTFLDSCMPLAICAACCALLLALATTAHADDGDADPSFAGDGYAAAWWPLDTYSIGSGTATARRDGGIVVANGYQYLDTEIRASVLITRVAVDGGPGSFERTRVDFDPALDVTETPHGVFELADGKLLLVASVYPAEAGYVERLALARLNADGSPDASFGTGGKRWVEFPGAPWLNGQLYLKAATLQADGKIVIAASARPCANSMFNSVVLRILPNGSPDPSFGAGGWQCLEDEDSRTVSDVAIDQLGRILISGKVNTNGIARHLFVARLTASGAQDPSFQGGGFALLDCPLPDTFCDSTAIVGARSGSSPSSFSRIFVAVLLGASVSQDSSFVIGLQEDGVIDPGFANDGYLDLTLEQGTRINALALRKDRRLVAAGSIRANGNNLQDFFAARFLFDGTLDNSFDGNGVNRYVFPGLVDTDDSVYALVLSAERPVLVGYIDDYVKDFYMGVLRLQSDAIFSDGFD